RDVQPSLHGPAARRCAGGPRGAARKPTVERLSAPAAPAAPPPAPKGPRAPNPSRFAAFQRELHDRMAVTLAGRQTGSPRLGRRRRVKLMEKFLIDGGAPLSGTLVPAGNKNGALPILASCVLTDDEVVVRNVPRVRDVEALLRILASLGVEVSWRGPNEVALCAAGVHDVEVREELAELIRASFLLAGPLLARFGRAVMSSPGGDVIGRRRLDPHLDAFRAMGAVIDCAREIVLNAPQGLRPSDVFMDEPSVMATENALMASALVPGTTVIGNAASEPHVQDLARLLVKMGADIQGIGSNLITVNGAKELHGCVHEVAPDHIEIGSFMALAGVTGGELRIKDTVPGDLRMIRLVFERVGLCSELD